MTGRNGHHNPWSHVPLLDLFAEAGIELKATRDGKYEGAHTYRHSLHSGRSLVVWANKGRWYCSNCKAKGDAADLLVDTGKAADRQEAERMLTERFGPPNTKERPHLTDVGNSQRLVELHQERIRYCAVWGKWLIWNGKRWALDEPGLITSFVKDVPKTLYKEAAEVAQKAASEPNEDRRDTLAQQAQALLSFAKASEARARLDNATYLAQSDPAVRVRFTELDSDPWLLNVENGVLNLRTGKLLPHNPKRLITKLAPVKYDPKATCPTWLSVLDRSMGGSQHLVAFLQRAFGYALTGDVSEQVFFVLWGAGANGKGTIVNCFLDLLGGYAMKATQELLMQKTGERHPTELANIFGARFVATVETDENRRLAESLVKELTGGDPITARHMREDLWTFKPTHKLFLATNHKPVIRGTDHAMWRRPKLVPFNVVIPREEWDTKLQDKLRAEWPGILAWAVRGYLDWQAHGFGIPEEVEQATRKWRADMDVWGNSLTTVAYADQI
jgi:putative DNA primase/helicase